MRIEVCGTGGADRKHAALASRDSACLFVETLVAAALGVSLPDLRAASRGPQPVALARQTAMYLVHIHLGLTLSEVGRRFGRDRTTVAHACRRIEDSRDDPLRERTLDCLEAAIARWLRGFLGDHPE